jgi:hypothetical protein
VVSLLTASTNFALAIATRNTSHAGVSNHLSFQTKPQRICKLYGANHHIPTPSISRGETSDACAETRHDKRQTITFLPYQTICTKTKYSEAHSQNVSLLTLKRFRTRDMKAYRVEYRKETMLKMIQVIRPTSDTATAIATGPCVAVATLRRPRVSQGLSSIPLWYILKNRFYNLSSPYCQNTQQRIAQLPSLYQPYSSEIAHFGRKLTPCELSQHPCSHTPASSLIFLSAKLTL